MKKVYLAAVAGNLGMLSVGMFLGWASPVLPVLIDGDDAKYPVRLTSDDGSWVASLPTLGVIPGPVICALVVNVIGRKNTMLFTVVPSIIGWLMIAFATSSWELYVSRFISGIGIGIAYSTTPMYLGEISPPRIRGNLGSMLTVAVKLGIAIAYMIGPFLSVKNFALVSLIWLCLFVVVFIWLPESPYQLMLRNTREKAINSLVQLRGKEDVYTDVTDDIERFVKADPTNETGFREILFVPGNRKALLISLFLGSIQQLYGSQAVLQYAQIIFDETNSKLEGKYLTIILGVMQVICTIVCMFVNDHNGRKSLLLISLLGSACSTAMVAVYFNLQHNHVNVNNIAWLPVVGIVIYVIAYNLGLSALPLTMIGELFPQNVKALCNMLVIIMINLWCFAVVKSYLVIAENAGPHVPFWIFTACSFASVLVTFFYVPETKGKTLEQIQKKLHSSPNY